MNRKPKKKSQNGALRAKRGYGGITAEARDAMRREQLIAGGVAKFGTTGYPATTIESLCATARVSTRDFYKYFAGKEDLLLAVYDRIIADTMQAVIDATTASNARDDDPTRLIQSSLEAFAVTMAHDERWARINFIEVVGVSRRVELRRREAIHGFAELVKAFTESLADRGLIDRTALSPVLWVAMVGAVHETLTDWVMQRERPPLETVVAELTRLFVAATRP